MTFSRITKIGALCTWIWVAFPSAAYAQRSAADIESARQLYNEGIALRESGNVDAALEKFKVAHALGNTPITGVELCKMHALLRQPVEAREACLGVARIPPVAAETSRSQDARREASLLAEAERAKIATLRLHILGAPVGSLPVVTVDGALIPVAALTEPRAMNPGHHDVIAKIEGGPEARSSVELGSGERKDVTLVVQAPPPEAQPPPSREGRAPTPLPRRSNGLATAGWIVGGIGVGVGAVAGLVAMSAKSDLSCPNGICGVEEHDALDKAKAWGNVSTGAFVVGGLGLALGLYATLSAPSASASSPAPKVARRSTKAIRFDWSPFGAGVHGSF